MLMHLYRDHHWLPTDKDKWDGQHCNVTVNKIKPPDNWIKPDCPPHLHINSIQHILGKENLIRCSYCALECSNSIEICTHITGSGGRLPCEDRQVFYNPQTNVSLIMEEEITEEERAKLLEVWSSIIIHLPMKNCLVN
jgi:hypothetical protein